MQLLSNSRVQSRSARALLLSVAVFAAIAASPTIADAQSRQRGGDRGPAGPRGSFRGESARPRGSFRGDRPRVLVQPSRPYYGRQYRRSANLGFFYGYPGFYGGYGFGRPFGPYGFNGLGYAYGWGAPGYGWGAPGWVAPYGYGISGYAGRPYGGLRIDLPQRDAEVYVDGYFVGTVDDFDGKMQQANLESGPHRVEVRDPEFETLGFEVNVEPGRTITYRGSLRPLP